MRQTDTNAYTWYMCAYSSALEVKNVNIVPFENILCCVWHIYLLVWLCTHMSVCTGMCVYLCAWEYMDIETKGWHAVPFLNYSPLYVRQGLLLSPEVINAAMLDGHSTLGIPLTLSFQCWVTATVFSQVIIHRNGMIFKLYSQLLKHKCQPGASPGTGFPAGEQKEKHRFLWAQGPKTLLQNCVLPFTCELSDKILGY